MGPMSSLRSTRLTSLAVSALSCLSLVGCGDPMPTTPASDASVADVPVDRPVEVDFADHTVPRLASAAEFQSIAAEEFGLSTVKFIITAFNDPTARSGRFYDSTFFTLHDQWYWFRLLNGARIPGDFVEPVQGLRFDTIADINRWAATQPVLPLDLAFYGDRLYSPRFYDYAFGATRRFGLATVIRVPPRASNPERWAFELEYGDSLSHAELTIFFDALRARLPAAIAGELRFLIRSPEQESLGQRMEAEHLANWDRLLRYGDIVVPGAREVYSEGVAAGRLRIIRRGESFDTVNNNDVVVMEAIPDVLPDLAALVTAVPQTPLAHINLLARNRAIPNVHVAGILDDPTINSLKHGYAPVLVFAEAPNRVVLSPITEAQYGRYRALVDLPPRVVTTPPVETMPYVIDLTARDPAEIATLATTIGGKSSGMIALLHTPDLDLPDAPHGITVRAYVEHFAPMRARVTAALADEALGSDARARRLVLEGMAAFRARTAAAADLAYADAFVAARPAGNPAGDFARGTGIRGLVESTPIAPATLAEIDRVLRAAYATLAPTQGIRFRSSSNVEDIEGFNGAGLYESYTGFLDPVLQPRASDRDKTIQRAIQRVWGSYWGVEAFEERRAGRIDHLSAAMAVMVHPRFDDELERATGVCTFTQLPPNAADAEELEINTQPGAESVANPNPALLPEVVRVSRARGSDTLRITRVRRATLSPDRDLFTDEVLRALFADTAAVTHRWLERENTPRPAARRARTLTLDFEFHDMLGGWPAVRTGPARPARLVLKQSRTLEPAPRVASTESQAWPVPRDVLSRARRVTTQTCTGEVTAGVTLTATLLRVQTDASLTPDVGFATNPFDASLTLTARGVVAALDWAADASYAADHTAFTTTRDGTSRVFDIASGSPARTGLDRARLDADGTLTVTRGARTVTARLACTDELLFATPRDFLLGLVPPR